MFTSSDDDGLLSGSTRRRLLLRSNLFLLAIVPLLLLAGVVYLQMSARLRESMEFQLRELAAVRHDWLEAHLLGLDRRARLISLRSDLLRAFDSGEEPDRQDLVGLVGPILADAAGADPSVVGLALFDALGNRLVGLGTAAGSLDPLPSTASTGNGPSTIALDSVTGGTGLVEVVTTPLPSDEGVRGFVRLDFSGAELLEIVSQRTGLGSTGEVLVGLRDDAGILHFVGGGRFTAPGALLRVPTDTTDADRLPLEEAIRGDEGLLEGHHDYREVPVIAATRHIHRTGWGMVAKMDRSEALAPIRALRRTLLLGVGLIATLLVAIALLIARSLEEQHAQLVTVNRMLRRSLLLSPFPTMVHAEDGEILLLSEQWTALTGYSREDLPTLEAWTELAYADRAPAARERIAALYESEGGPVQKPGLHIRARDGSELVWNFSSMALGRHPDGRRTVLSMAVDVTARNELVDRLRTATERLDATLDATPLPLFYLDPEGLVRRWNRSAEAVFGWREEEVLGRFLPTVPEDRLAEFHEFRTHVLGGEYLDGAETLRAKKDGTLIPIRAYGAPVLGNDGRVEGIVALAEDVSESKRQEEGLRSLNRALRFVSASNGALVRDVAGSDLAAETCRVSIETGGYAHAWIAEQDVGGETVHLHQQGAGDASVDLLAYPHLLEEIAAAQRVGLAFVARGLGSGETSWEGRLNEEGYAAIAVLPFPESSGRRGFLALAHEDAKALDEAELGVLRELVSDLAYGLQVSSLRHDHSLIQEAVANLSVGVSIVDASRPELPLVFVNQGFSETTGYPPEEALGRPFFFLHGPATDEGAVAELTDALREGRGTQVILRNYRKSGTGFWNRLTLQPIPDTDGSSAYFVAIQEDVTEHRRIGEELQHRARLSAVGELAGGVAHDFRNILTASQGLLELSFRDLELSEEVAANLSEVRDLVARGRSVTDRLLSMSRRGPTNPEVVSLGELLSETGSLIAHTARDDIVVDIQLVPDRLMGVRIDRDDFTHALLNVARNAEQAMPTGGSLHLSCLFPVRPDEDDWWPADLEHSARDWARVTLRDTGVGMDEETLKRAFDPYFTTKPTGEGTGLGLPSVFAAVEAMGGRIWLESEPGEGTSVHILLPTEPVDLPRPAPGDDGPGRESERPPRVGTILLAEDDPSVLRVFSRALERAGHTVIAAVDGAAAVEAFRNDPEAVDLVITDGVMPKLSGAELAAAVWEACPTMPVVVTSGFGSEDLKADFPENPPGLLQFHPKPLTLEQLLQVVRNVLAQGE